MGQYRLHSTLLQDSYLPALGHASVYSALFVASFDTYNSLHMTNPEEPNPKSNNSALAYPVKIQSDVNGKKDMSKSESCRQYLRLIAPFGYSATRTRIEALYIHTADHHKMNEMAESALGGGGEASKTFFELPASPAKEGGDTNRAQWQYLVV